MSTRELIIDWLDKHQTFNPKEVSEADYNHFVNVLVDVVDYCIIEYCKHYERKSKDLNDAERP